jgi:hypothetical protein
MLGLCLVATTGLMACGEGAQTDLPDTQATAAAAGAVVDADASSDLPPVVADTCDRIRQAALQEDYETLASIALQGQGYFHYGEFRWILDGSFTSAADAHAVLEDLAERLRNHGRGGAASWLLWALDLPCALDGQEYVWPVAATWTPPFTSEQREWLLQYYSEEEVQWLEEVGMEQADWLRISEDGDWVSMGPIVNTE